MRTISDEILNRYLRQLREEEKSEGTIEMYLRVVRQFRAWCSSRDCAEVPSNADGTPAGDSRAVLPDADNQSAPACAPFCPVPGTASVPARAESMAPVAAPKAPACGSIASPASAAESAPAAPETLSVPAGAPFCPAPATASAPAAASTPASAEDPSLLREAVLSWKQHLIGRGLRAVTINSYLAALNHFLRYLGRADCCPRSLRTQRRTFRSSDRELTRDEYKCLLSCAHSLGRDRTALVLETLCGTGIRVSELRFITVEAAREGSTDISLKGKIRTILLPKRLCTKLLRYADKAGVETGTIFLNRSGRPLDRRQIWAEMKDLCETAGVAARKVFPHNLRHLFAITFWNENHDLVLLADVLGHSSTETTRLYLIKTGEEHARVLNGLDLVT